MKNSVTARDEPLTPEVVLGILRDSYLQQCQYDPEAEPGISLTFESSIGDWRCACDLVGWKALGRAMNKWFGINHSDEEWHKVLEPAESKSLLGVCELISSTASRPLVAPINILGNSCLEAGAFVALREVIASAGTPVDSLKPSTRLEPWLKKNLGVFLYAVGKLAPEVLPPVKIENSFLIGLGHLMFLSGILLSIVSIFVGHEPAFALASTFCILVGFLLIRMRPKRISFDNLEKFSDVCQLIVFGPV